MRQVVSTVLSNDTALTGRRVNTERQHELASILIDGFGILVLYLLPTSVK